MGFDVLQAIKPVLNLMPSVPKPPRDIEITKRLVYTLGALVLYLACSMTPLYGVRKVAHQDPMYHLHLMTASSKFTLMELGISPIVSSGMILQVVSGLGLITHDRTKPESSALFDAAQKLAGLIVTAFQAASAVLTQQYGPRDDVGFVGGVFIFLQLMAAGIVVILSMSWFKTATALGPASRSSLPRTSASGSCIRSSRSSSAAKGAASNSKGRSSPSSTS
jgi:protein transport protein SEC61 subunit alpha